MNLNISRKHIEDLLLSCFLNQSRTLPLDSMEFEAHKIDYKLFRYSKLNKYVAKAIFNFQEENKAIDDLLIYEYISKKVDIDANEFYQLSCTNWVTYQTFLKYEKDLKELDKLESISTILEGI